MKCNGSAGRSLLFEFYKAQRDSFNESYEKMTMGTFTVKVDGRDFTVRPNTATTGTFVGVLYDNEGTIKDLDKKLNDSSYTLPTLFNWLNASRTILEAGDFWLLLLGGVLVLVFKAAAPLMMAVAIDQKLAHKVSYPFVWGAGVLTLIWPAVSYFIRALAYLFGNMAMALGDSEPLYIWDYCHDVRDQEQLRLARAYGGNCRFHDDDCRGCLWISPYLAYRFSMGQIYEGVSAAMSQFAAMIIGTGVEAYSTTAAASHKSGSAEHSGPRHIRCTDNRSQGQQGIWNVAQSSWLHSGQSSGTLISTGQLPAQPWLRLGPARVRRIPCLAVPIVASLVTTRICRRLGLSDPLETTTRSALGKRVKPTQIRKSGANKSGPEA